MGSVRLFLALIVVVGHSGLGEGLGSPRVAVQMFFMISGFLMAYVLNKDGAYAKVTPFYLNRALRIYPIYWVVATITCGSWLIGSDRFMLMRQLGRPAVALLAFSNLFIFGQDAVMFLRDQAGVLVASPDLSVAGLWRFLLIPPAWSLSIELTFYLVAPFIVRSLPVTATLAVLSFLLAAIGWSAGLDHDPWTYRFFPFEIGLFLLGALAEMTTRAPAWVIDRLIAPSPALVILLLVSWPLGVQLEPYSTIVRLVVLAFLLRYLFVFQEGRRWDVLIGDLSYPLYICHFLVLEVGGKLSEHHGGGGRLAGQIAGILASLAVAFALERGVARPVERLRRHIRDKAVPIDSLDRVEPVRAALG